MGTKKKELVESPANQNARRESRAEMVRSMEITELHREAINTK